MVREPTCGTTTASILVIGMRTRSMGMVFTNGQTVVDMRVNGRKTTCMVGVFIPGGMVVDMRASTTTTGSMGMGLTLGRMGGSTLGSG